ncbi:MAG: ketoacyl-ACP synthase III [Chloroflexi bacterium]|jgi:3-oxoacyl-[acyl-carrier-protein] synthase-3|nr:ketoacyl-ACP synthase III [Chloroflexota bacterium]
MPRYAQIASTGRYVPARVRTNAELDALLGEPVDQWLIENVGIRERRLMADDEVTSDLAVHAAREALVRAQVPPEDVDLIILATDTPDYVSPGTASVVQLKLGAVNAGTYDVNSACAAWVIGLDIASRYIATDASYNHILVIGAYGMTRFVDWTDKRTCTLFGDGGGAVLLSAGDQPGFLGGSMRSDGAFHDYMGVFIGGTVEPTGGAETRPQRLEIRKRFPPDTNNLGWPPLVRGLMDKIGRPVSDIDRIYFTQLNLRTIQVVLADLGLPPEKTHTIMDKWGYTGSACMPMALDDAIEQQRGPQPGELVVFCGSGAGYTMAATAFIWTS